MNEHPQPQPIPAPIKQVRPRVLREVTPEWDEIMRLAAQIPFGEIVIKIQNKKINCAEYKVTRRPADTDNFEIITL